MFGSVDFWTSPDAFRPHRYERRTFLTPCSRPVLSHSLCSAPAALKDRLFAFVSLPTRLMRDRLLVRFSAFLFGALGLLVTFSGCDSAPGVGNLIPNPPTLSDFSFTPLEFVYEGSGDTAQIPLTLDVAVSAAPGTSVTVNYFVRREFQTELVAQGTLAADAGGRYSGGETMAVPRGETGMYLITVTIISSDGLVGNEVTGLLRFASVNLGPPVITEIDGPMEFTPPGDLRLIAVVTDPDGLGNIARVIGETPTGVPFEMFDDGLSLGDEVAGDGRYTATFNVPSATPGEQTFTFIATDNFGVDSEEVSFTVTILP